LLENFAKAGGLYESSERLWKCVNLCTVLEECVVAESWKLWRSQAAGGVCEYWKISQCEKFLRRFEDA
jgi:hypothetical protein